MPDLRLSALPGSLLRLAGQHGSSAVANAAAAAGALSAAVRERGDLTHLLLHEAATSPDAGSLSVLTDHTCWELLATRDVGRLAYIARQGVPDIVPVNYVLLHGDVLIRSGPGPKLQAAERQDLVAFEVDDLDAADRSGWSVVVHGRATRLSWAEQQHLGLTPPPDGAPWADGPRRQVIRISPRRVTGRRISGAPGREPESPSGRKSPQDGTFGPVPVPCRDGG